MSHKIQITVDEELNDLIISGAKRTGLSRSSYARLALLRALTGRNTQLLDQAIHDVENNKTQKLTHSQFKRQLDHL